MPLVKNIDIVAYDIDVGYAWFISIVWAPLMPRIATSRPTNPCDMMQIDRGGKSVELCVSRMLIADSPSRAISSKIPTQVPDLCRPSYCLV